MSKTKQTLPFSPPSICHAHSKGGLAIDPVSHEFLAIYYQKYWEGLTQGIGSSMSTATSFDIKIIRKKQDITAIISSRDLISYRDSQPRWHWSKWAGDSF